MSFQPQRIAILDPLVCYSRPCGELSTRARAQETRQWATQVQSKGADAVYIRMHRGLPWEKEVIGQIEQETGLLILVSDQWKELAGERIGVNFRSNAIAAALPKPSLSCQSCHSLADLHQAVRHGRNFVFLSPVFPTRSHPDAHPLGLDTFSQLCQQSPLPIIALGGITWDNIHQVEAAGAAGIAGIRLFLT